jgi:hypothetical protein
VIQAIRDLGLEWQIIFNKGAVMLLPPGVNKASGLVAALDALQLSALNVAGIGDAENDHAFLSVCGCSVAVANALDAVKATADLVTKADHGAGVAEAIDALLAEPSSLSARAAGRRQIAVGAKYPDAVLRVDQGDVLIAGSSGFGKSTLATALIEKLAGQGFQLAIIDPEADYDELQPSIVLGDAKHEPVADEAMDVLDKPKSPPLVVNLLGLKVEERPSFFRALMTRIAKLAGDTARPHWLVIDEAHHIAPTGADMVMLDAVPAIFVTVHPDQMLRSALASVGVLLVVGPKAQAVVDGFCAAIGVSPPHIPHAPFDEAVLYWNRRAGAPRWIEADRPQQGLKRHVRKYAEGELGEDKSFYFRGPKGALNLRAQNLRVFLQIADGVDDATWLHHLHRGDYARWFREAIKDDDLADEAEGLQGEADVADTRARMHEIVERRYTAPATAS